MAEEELEKQRLADVALLKQQQLAKEEDLKRIHTQKKEDIKKAFLRVNIRMPT